MNTHPQDLVKRAKSLAKSLSKQLASHGAERPLSDCQEAAARGLGFNDWHHLASRPGICFHLTNPKKASASVLTDKLVSALDSLGGAAAAPHAPVCAAVTDWIRGHSDLIAPTAGSTAEATSDDTVHTPKQIRDVLLAIGAMVDNGSSPYQAVCALETAYQEDGQEALARSMCLLRDQLGSGKELTGTAFRIAGMRVPPEVAAILAVSGPGLRGALVPAASFLVDDTRNATAA